MAKIVLPEIGSGYNTALINDNFRKLQEALNEQVAYRDNPPGEPNQLESDIDTNEQRIYNLPAPVLPHEAARYQEVLESVTLANATLVGAVAARNAAEGFADLAEESFEQAAQLVEDLGDISEIPELVIDAQTAATQAAASAAAVAPLVPQIVENSKDEWNNNSFKGFAAKQCSFMSIDDSLGSSVGASDYKLGCAYTFFNSIINAGNTSWPNGSSFGGFTIVNMLDAVSSGHVASAVTPTVQGLTAELQLGGLQTFTVTGYAVDFLDVFYKAAVPGTSITIAKNGANIRTFALDSTPGLKYSFDGTKVSDLYLTKETDVFTFTVSAGGGVNITGIIPWRQAPLAVAPYLVALGGTTYKDYITPEKMQEIAVYLSFGRAGNDKYLMLNLGTNSMYNPTKYDSPSDMIDDLQALILGVGGRVQGGFGTLKVCVGVPAKSRETNFPIMPGYVYEDYVNAIVTYCRANGYAMVRNDRTQLSENNPIYFDADGLHFSDKGHQLAGENRSRAAGITYLPYEKTTYGLSTPPAEMGVSGMRRIIFNPTLVGSSVAGTHTYNFQRGYGIETALYYDLHFELSLSSIDPTMDGAVGIAGFTLPFNVSVDNQGTGYITYRSLVNLGAGYDSLGVRQLNGTMPFLQLLQSGNSGAANVLTITNFVPGAALCGAVRFFKP